MTDTQLAAQGTSSAGPGDWRHEAACREEDPELFFPIGNTGPAVLQAEEAKAVCRRCEVTETCLRWALDTGQDAGVWGGLTEDERRGLKRRNARAMARARGTSDRTREEMEARGLVSAEATLDVIIACRKAEKSWREIARLLGTSTSSCREIYTGIRENVARALDETARSLAGLVDV